MHLIMPISTGFHNIQEEAIQKCELVGKNGHKCKDGDIPFTLEETALFANLLSVILR